MIKFKQMTRWTLCDGLRSLGIFFAAYTGILILGMVIMKAVGFTMDESDSFGLGAGIIYLFVLGIMLFAQHLRVGLANGVSRKSVFAAVAICGAAVSAGASVGESILALIGGRILETKTLYAFSLGSSGAGGSLLTHFISMISMGIAVMALGMFIGGAYYRMNKLLKVVVSIAVPILLVGGSGAVVSFMPEAAKEFLVGQVIQPVMKFFMASPWNGIAGWLIFAGVMLGLVFLLMRRAPAKAAS